MTDIVLKLHLATAPAEVFALLATDEGRQRFWVERSRQSGTSIEMLFPNLERLVSIVLQAVPGERFSVTYFDGTRVDFELRPAEGGGTELTLRERGVPATARAENLAGWVSVLLALKAAADFGVDLRNHDVDRTWDHGYVDN